MHAQYFLLAAAFAMPTIAAPLPAPVQALAARSDLLVKTRHLLEMVERELASPEASGFSGHTDNADNDLSTRDVDAEGDWEQKRDLEEKRQYRNNHNDVNHNGRRDEEKRQYRNNHSDVNHNGRRDEQKRQYRNNHNDVNHNGRRDEEKRQYRNNHNDVNHNG